MTSAIRNHLLVLLMLLLACGPVSSKQPGPTGHVTSAEASLDVPVNTDTPQLEAFPQAPPEALKAPRTLYVLHGGMSDPGNGSVKNIYAYLLSRGISDQDIVMLENIYPAIPPAITPLPNLSGKNKGKKLSAYLKEKALETKRNALLNWNLYKQSADLDSDISRYTYKTLTRRLEALQKQQPQQPVRLVWIGLSAGGQLGLTMAEKFSLNTTTLQDEARVNFDTIVTMGSPIVRNNAPHAVRIIANISDQDQVLVQTTRPGYSGLLLGTEVFSTPPNLDNNDEVRKIQMRLSREMDPAEGHNLWHRDPAVLGQALSGVVPQ